MAAYEVKFKCTNCSSVFIKQLERGAAALGRAGECPNCGCTQETVRPSGQKIGMFPVISEDSSKSKLQLLLEEFGVINPKE